MFDFLVTDPLLKRLMKMNKIQDKLKSNTVKRQKLLTESLELTDEYESLRFQAKTLKKTGRLPVVQ